MCHVRVDLVLIRSSRAECKSEPEADGYNSDAEAKEKLDCMSKLFLSFVITKLYSWNFT